jgi:uncharacterized membrane protein YgcG
LWYNTSKTEGNASKIRFCGQGGVAMRKLLAFVFGFLLGAMVGMAIATLLAPAEGEATRGQLQQRVQYVVDEGKKAATERRAELESQLEQLKQGRSVEQIQ